MSLSHSAFSALPLKEIQFFKILMRVKVQSNEAKLHGGWWHALCGMSRTGRSSILPLSKSPCFSQRSTFSQDDRIFSFSVEILSSPYMDVTFPYALSRSKTPELNNPACLQGLVYKRRPLASFCPSFIRVPGSVAVGLGLCGGSAEVSWSLDLPFEDAIKCHIAVLKQV